MCAETKINFSFYFPLFSQFAHNETTQNLLFYYDSETSTRPLGLIFLEGCYCERLISAPSYLTSTATSGGAQSSSSSSKISKEEKLQVSNIIRAVIFEQSPFFIVSLFLIGWIVEYLRQQTDKRCVCVCRIK